MESTRLRILTLLLIMCLINCYDVLIKTMLGSYLPTVVCRKAHVLFALFVFVCAQWCLTRIDRMGCMHIAVSCGRRLSLAGVWVHPRFLHGFVLVNVLVFCVLCFCFVCLRPVSCVPNVTSFSLDCPLLIDISVFSNVYFNSAH